MLAVVAGSLARDMNSVGGHSLVDQGLDLALNLGELPQVGAIRQEGVAFARLADLWGSGGTILAVTGAVGPVALEHGDCAFRDGVPGNLVLHFFGFVQRTSVQPKRVCTLFIVTCNNGVGVCCWWFFNVFLKYGVLSTARNRAREAAYLARG